MEVNKMDNKNISEQELEQVNGGVDDTTRQGEPGSGKTLLGWGAEVGPEQYDCSGLIS